MNWDLVQSIIRVGMNALATLAVTKGYGDNSIWEAIAGGVLAIASLIWSHYHQATMKTIAAEAVTPSQAMNQELVNLQKPTK